MQHIYATGTIRRWDPDESDISPVLEELIQQRRIRCIKNLMGGGYEFHNNFI